MAPTTRANTRSNPQISATLDEVEEQPAAPMSSDYGESDTELGKPKARKRKNKKDQESNTPTGPPVKRARGKQGKLKGIMNMPIEVFTEIAKYLHPLDLILLSRANKFFRQLLLNRSAVQTWRHSLANIPGLPPCPAGLCEPKYAALVFSKHCSMCGNQALRQMDPVLQVRLCTLCRDRHLVPYEYRGYYLVPRSDTIVPASKRGAAFHCLRDEVEAIHAELDAFAKARDTAAEGLWRQGKQREVEERMMSAQPLIKFLQQLEVEQEDDIAARRSQRETEIRARLLALGWVEGDLQMRQQKIAKQWNSLVCIAKPLTERAWVTILPKLTPLLEENQKLRLEIEASRRRYERQTAIRQWISSELNKSPPYACVVTQSPPETLSTGEPSLVTSDLAHTQQEANLQSLNVGSSTLQMPCPGTFKVESWTLFQQVMETDRPKEEFETALEELRPTFNDQMNEWRTGVELALVTCLPANETPPLVDTPINPGILEVGVSNPTPKLEILVGEKSLDALPAHIRQLLRADTVFVYKFLDSVYFYPEDFRSWGFNGVGSLQYCAGASSIAKKLLAALGRPDATRLEFQANGSLFSCGRCGNRNRVDWRTLIEHYRAEQHIWDKVQSKELFKNGQTTYVFTHDTQVDWNDKPLVRISTDEDLGSAYGNLLRDRRPCKMCTTLAIYRGFATENLVVEHLRDVHQFIQDPEVINYFD